MRKKPYTTDELFRTICGLLKENGKMPDILEYSCEDYRRQEIRYYTFDFTNDLEYGGSEGIYLSIGILLNPPWEGKEHFHLGTFKTLDTSPEAMHAMAALLADFLIEGTAFVNRNLDDFTWIGGDIDILQDDKNGGTKRVPLYSCCTMENTLSKKDELLSEESVEAVIIRDNETRKETIYRKDGSSEKIPARKEEDE